MPELPEVETVCRQLNTVLPGLRILRIDVRDPRLAGDYQPLAGRSVLAVRRRGKFLQIDISGNLAAELHLRMSGRLFWRPEPSIAGPSGSGCREEGAAMSSGERAAPRAFPDYRRLVITFCAGTLELIDPRRFATFRLLPAATAAAAVDDALGGLAAERLVAIARTRRVPVKSFLMDQRSIAGIGNIYACEILFAAGIDPRRPASDLSGAEWEGLAGVAAGILERAVVCRGTTLSDWRDLFGSGGTNQEHLAVYARQGEACLRCGSPIVRIRQSGRGTWFCPTCQR